jgi:serine/threonine-protein kinase
LVRQTIDGRYRLEEQLGTGRRGFTYRARHFENQRIVALKLFDEPVDGSAPRRASFEREISSLTVLGHPNMVSIADFGVHEGRPWVAGEWLDGETLALRMLRGPVPLAAAMAIVRQLLAALASAHAAQVIHRDLKPSNVFLERRAVQGRERVRLFDFAPAVRPQRSCPPAPAPAGFATPFDPPEVLTGEVLDARTDVFGVGATLFAILSGAHPFEHGSGDFASESAREGGHGVTRALPGVDASLMAWMRRATTLDRQLRFSDAADMLSELIDLMPRDLLHRSANSDGTSRTAAPPPARPSQPGTTRSPSQPPLPLMSATSSGVHPAPLPSTSPLPTLPAMSKTTSSGERAAPVPSKPPAPAASKSSRGSPPMPLPVTSPLPVLPSMAAPPASLSRSVISPLWSLFPPALSASKSGETASEAPAPQPNGPTDHEPSESPPSAATSSNHTPLGVESSSKAPPANASPLSSRGTLRPVELRSMARAAAPRLQQLLAAGVFGAVLIAVFVIVVQRSGHSRARQRERNLAAAISAETQPAKKPASDLEVRPAPNVQPPPRVKPPPADVPVVTLVEEPAAPVQAPSASTSDSDAHPSPSPTSGAAGAPASKRPASRDPWQQSAPPELTRLHNLAINGALAEETKIKALREYNRKHPTDARGFLVIAQLYLNRMWRTDCVQELTSALERDPTVRGAPEIMPALLEMVENDRALSLAEKLILKVYGTEALDAIDHAFEDVRTPAAAVRLHKLRLKISESAPH